MANYNQNWNDQMGGNYYGFGQNPNQGIASPNLNVPQDMRKYFSDRNQMVYPGADRNIHEGFGTADVSSTFPPPEKTGILENFYGFIFKNQELKGNFTLFSNQLAVSDFMTTGSTTASTGNTASKIDFDGLRLSR